ncbi:hypothetical protein GCK32_011569 [Trichostrongylus colubriformis]|uniref:Uncharacterized protein n=1 Tax=Trichostrongylus colubriformis TaxID=6319 RepID=A0AAN8FR24_TRICO
MLLLPLVSLLIYEGSAQNENLVLVTKLNEIREKVAKGDYATQQGYLSPSQTMFALFLLSFAKKSIANFCAILAQPLFLFGTREQEGTALPVLFIFCMFFATRIKPEHPERLVFL